MFLEIFQANKNNMLCDELFGKFMSTKHRLFSQNQTPDKQKFTHGIHAPLAPTTYWGI